MRNLKEETIPSSYASIPELRHSSREMVRELGFFRNLYSDTGITAVQAHILMELDIHEVMSLGVLARTVQMDNSTASRTVARMIQNKWIEEIKNSGDQRLKLLTLSPQGKAHTQLIHQTSVANVKSAFDVLNEEEREKIVQGVSLYAKALKRSRIHREYRVRPIEKKDNAQIGEVIRTVVPEFGTTLEEMDRMLPEVRDLYHFYQSPKSKYFVLEKDGRIVAGAGIAPLKGAKPSVCELQKMYMLKEHRGVGLGELLLKNCLRFAEDHGYKSCYLDTLEHMTHAIKLYQKYGFKKLSRPIGTNGHFRCNAYFVKEF